MSKLVSETDVFIKGTIVPISAISPNTNFTALAFVSVPALLICSFTVSAEASISGISITPIALRTSGEDTLSKSNAEVNRSFAFSVVMVPSLRSVLILITSCTTIAASSGPFDAIRLVITLSA